MSSDAIYDNTFYVVEKEDEESINSASNNIVIKSNK